jgi:phosphatidylserine/phosphatidylglycerophosphate/cardiolipin synthase-like enzyme
MIPPHNRKLAAALLGMLGATILCRAADPAPKVPASVRVAFNRDCESMALDEIRRAEREIRVAIFSINRKNILSALTTAARRGVRVTVKYDAQMAKDENMKTAVAQLKKGGVQCVPVAMKPDYASMHHKFMVIDGLRVLTGSYNFTSAASSLNEENLVLIEAPSTAALFSAHFDRIKGN